MSKLDGLKPEFRKRLVALLDEAELRLWVNNGFRSRQEQQRLYDLFRQGKGNPANRPGSSKHEIGEAADLGGNMQLLGELAQKYGFRQPYVKSRSGKKSEPWHIELDPLRKPLRAKKKVAKELKTTETKEHQMAYRKISCPTGGFWLLKTDDGGVSNHEGAPFFGSVPGVDTDGIAAPATDLCPFVQDEAVCGYWVVLANGQLYGFEAPHLGSYDQHPEWHGGGRIIIGVVQTGGFRMGDPVTYQEIGREPSDQNYVVDTYDFPVS